MRDSRSRAPRKAPRRDPLSAKKTPKQERSRQLVSDILEAALRVLRRDGARRFTTVRVAEAAGVSVGSLYQYFPNKQALLFRLQAEEWRDTSALLAELFADVSQPPLERLRRATLAFFRSEQDEAVLRQALELAVRQTTSVEAPAELLARAPETRDHRRRYEATLRAFIDEALPTVAPATRAFAIEFIALSMSSLAERITASPRSRAEVDRWAKACADAHVAYLETLTAR
ncbi:MAG: TetR family transcriptional regulator [Polyangiaceae bacterium]